MQGAMKLISGNKMNQKQPLPNNEPSGVLYEIGKKGPLEGGPFLGRYLIYPSLAIFFASKKGVLYSGVKGALLGGGTLFGTGYFIWGVCFILEGSTIFWSLGSFLCIPTRKKMCHHYKASKVVSI